MEIKCLLLLEVLTNLHKSSYVTVPCRALSDDSTACNLHGNRGGPTHPHPPFIPSLGPLLIFLSQLPDSGGNRFTISSQWLIDPPCMPDHLYWMSTFNINKPQNLPHPTRPWNTSWITPSPPHSVSGTVWTSPLPNTLSAVHQTYTLVKACLSGVWRKQSKL